MKTGRMRSGKFQISLLAAETHGTGSDNEFKFMSPRITSRHESSRGNGVKHSAIKRSRRSSIAGNINCLISDEFRLASLRFSARHMQTSPTRKKSQCSPVGLAFLSPETMAAGNSNLWPEPFRRYLCTNNAT